MQINVNDINLFYTCQGVGEPLIMLHGNGEDHTIFDEAVEVLSKYFKVYAIENKGIIVINFVSDDATAPDPIVSEFPLERKE